MVLRASWGSLGLHFGALGWLLGASWAPLCGALWGLSGASWEPGNHLGILLGALVVLLLGSSRSIFFEIFLFLLFGSLVVDFASRR